MAEEFLKATQILTKENRNLHLAGKPVVRVPSIMVHAVSLELYLKCLFVIDRSKPPPQTHDLKRLFEALVPDTQTKMRAHFDPSSGQGFIDRIRTRHPDSVFWSLPPKFTLDFALYSSSKTFEHIRYEYEREALQREQWYGDPLVKAARALILELHPQWAVGRRRQPQIHIAPIDPNR